MKTQAYLTEGGVVNNFGSFVLKVGTNFLRDVARKKSSSIQLSADLDRLPTHSNSNSSLSATPQFEAPLFDLFLDHEAAPQSTRKTNPLGSSILLRVLFNLSAVDAAKMMSIMEGDDVTGAGIDMRLTRERRRLGEFLESRGVLPVDLHDFSPGEIFGKESIVS